MTDDTQHTSLAVVPPSFFPITCWTELYSNEILWSSPVLCHNKRKLVYCTSTNCSPFGTLSYANPLLTTITVTIHPPTPHHTVPCFTEIPPTPYPHVLPYNYYLLYCAPCLAYPCHYLTSIIHCFPLGCSCWW